MKFYIFGVDVLLVLCYWGWLFFFRPSELAFSLLLGLLFLVIQALAHTFSSWIHLFLLGIFALLPEAMQPLSLGVSVVYIAFYLYVRHHETIKKELYDQNTALLVEQKNFRKYKDQQEAYELQLREHLRLEQRRELSQDIHDLLGQTFTPALLSIQAAHKVLEHEPQKAKVLLEQSSGMLRETSEQVRNLVHAMQTSLSAHRLSSMQLLCEKFEKESHLEVLFTYEGDVQRIGVHAWHILHRNTAEVFANTLRHANATRVCLNLRVLPGMIHFQTQDDGVGCENLQEDMGIRGMRERLEQMGGSLIIDGHEGMRTVHLIPLGLES